MSVSRLFQHSQQFVHPRSVCWQVYALALIVCCVSQTFAQTRFDDSTDRDRSFGFSGLGSNWQGSNWLGGTTTQTRQWRLGVSGDNTETGVLVRDVSNNSAASRARIEAGDLIVNVSGFQVGMVGGRLYDLVEEINRRADTSGFVTLVVQDHRSGRLASVRVKLDDHQALISGTLVYRERNPLPSDAVVTVQIENVSRPYYTVRGGQTTFRPNSGTNIPFEIAYDPAYIWPQDTYQVRAFVTSGGRTIMDTPQPQRILNGNPSNQVRLQLASLLFTPSSGSVISAGYPNYNEIDDRLITMYRKYLKRDPTIIELAALRATPGIETRLASMPLELMAAQEYFDAVGNNNSVWLERVFKELVGRNPTSAELQQWMQRYSDLRFSRTELLRQLQLAVR